MVCVHLLARLSLAPSQKSVTTCYMPRDNYRASERNRVATDLCDAIPAARPSSPDQLDRGFVYGVRSSKPLYSLFFDTIPTARPYDESPSGLATIEGYH
jgi:hypothetical protein